MTLEELYVEGYRSIRDMNLRLKRMNVFVGENGCGKTNLYKSLHLITEAARGRFARAMAEDGGMPSALWAGRRGKGPVRMKIGFKLDLDGPLRDLVSQREKNRLSPECRSIRYELTCGLPIPTSADESSPSMFNLDPQIKTEELFYLNRGDKVKLLERKVLSATLRELDGTKIQYPYVPTSESVISELREPHRFPEVALLREEIIRWRFYHTFRTDPGSPIRQPQVAVRTPVLDSSGVDLASALQTIIEVGDRETLRQFVREGFNGADLLIDSDGQRLNVCLQNPGFGRPFGAHELSDGTLQCLCLVAALLTPRPPALLVFNEPETSVHPRLLPNLARLLAQASSQSQIFLTTHSRELADLVCAETSCTPIALRKVRGETVGPGSSLKESSDLSDDGQVSSEPVDDSVQNFSY